MNKISRFLILIIGLVGLTACGSNLGREAFEKGLNSLEEGDYEKAMISFEISRDEGFESIEMDEIYSLVEDYLRAEELNHDGNYEEALSLLDNLSPEYKDYPIAKDLKNLKFELESNLEEVKDDKILDEFKSDDKASKEGVDGVIGTTNPTNNPNKPTFKKYSKEYYRNETSQQREDRIKEKKAEKRRFIQEKKNRYR